MNRILILLASLLVVGNVYALPPCPASGVFHNCFGTFTFTSGNEYVGEWKDGKRHGYGTFRFVDGDQYVGEYKDGKPHGQGAYKFADGDQYVGEYKDGKPHGHGTYTWADGDKYVGEYKDGKPHGQGAYTWADGDQYVGEYKDGSAWTGITYDKNGSVVSKLARGVTTKLIRDDKNVMDDTHKK